MSVLWVEFNLHKTLLSMIDLVMRFTWYDSPQNEKCIHILCRQHSFFDRRESETIQGIRDPLQIHLKSFRSTSLIGTIGVMVSIAGFHPVGVSSNLTWCSII